MAINVEATLLKLLRDPGMKRINRYLGEGRCWDKWRWDEMIAEWEVTIEYNVQRFEESELEEGLSNRPDLEKIRKELDDYACEFQLRRLEASLNVNKIDRRLLKIDLTTRRLFLRLSEEKEEEQREAA